MSNEKASFIFVAFLLQINSNKQINKFGQSGSLNDLEYRNWEDRLGEDWVATGKQNSRERGERGREKERVAGTDKLF
jgi:hypothetical protein